ncbi:MAG: autotransporter domain-containing protein [Methylobacterium frigidaeris]
MANTTFAAGSIVQYPVVRHSTKRTLARPACKALLALLAASVSPLVTTRIAAAQTADWNLYGSGGSTYLSFFFAQPVPGTKAVNHVPAASAATPITESPSLQVQVGTANAAYFIMDTGSTGILISSSEIPNFKDIKAGGRSGTLVYSSSGIVNDGVYLDLPVTVTGANGNSVTSTVSVLAVTQRSCQTGARHCDPTTINDQKIFMMGVGFGRETDIQPKGTPDKNPFLNVTSTSTDASGGVTSPGYIVSRTGVQVGLDAQNTQGGFTFVKLTRNGTYDDWNAAPACIAVKGSTTTCGTSLVDTGISKQMYLQVPHSQLPASDGVVKDGTTLTFLLPGTDPAHPLDQASYTFTAGTANPLNPGDLIRPDYVAPFVNTSALFLNGFDYLYDYGNGFVGYRRNPVEGARASVTPMLSLTGPAVLPDGFATNLPTVIHGGTTLVTSGGIQLAGAISGSGGLAIGTTGAFTGVRPQGSLVGNGTVTLTGINTYTGGTTLNNGVLAISSDRNLGDASGGLTLRGGVLQTTAALDIRRAVTLGGQATIQTDAATTLAGTVGGGGSLTKSGASSLTLSGVLSYGGPTFVQAGSLYVNSELASSVTVGSGATLGGHGRVSGDVDILPGGHHAPGNSIGTIRIGGNLTFQSGSHHDVEVSAEGRSDRTEVGGAASLDGTLHVLAEAGTYAPRTRYTVLTAAGGISGRFADITSNYAFLTPSLRYEARAVDLTLTRNDVAFSSIAQNRNQGAVADAIQAAGPASALYARTVGLSTSEAQAAFQGLGGDIHASSIATQFETAFFVREALLDRLRWGEGARLDYGRLPAAYAADMPGRPAAPAPVPATVVDPRVLAVWGQGFGIFGRAGQDGNAAGLARQTSGFVFGADARLEAGFRLGVAGGYTMTALDSTTRLQSGGIESAFGGVYGGAAFGPVSLRLGAVYADNALWTRRVVGLAGLSDAASARTGGATVQGFGEAGYRLDLPAVAGLPAGASFIEPFVGGASVHIGRDRFVETGGAAALMAAARDYAFGTVTAGLRGRTDLDAWLGLPLSARGLVGYRRTFGDVLPTALVAFASGPGFLTAGLPISRDAVVAEAGLDLRVSASSTLGLSYTGQAGARAADHAVRGSFVHRF